VSKIDKSIQTLIDDMIETMRAAPGVGLAATQVGVPLRLAVIEVEEMVTVLINPEIVRIGEPVDKDEGCLSVPGYWGKINRGETAVVKARDRHGKEIRIKGEGLLAQALQHEIITWKACSISTGSRTTTTFSGWNRPASGRAANGRRPRKRWVSVPALH